MSRQPSAKNRFLFIFVIAVTVIAVAVFAVVIARENEKERELQIAESLWQQSIEEASKENEELREKQTRELTREEIIAIARRRFGLVFPKEIILTPRKE